MKALISKENSLGIEELESPDLQHGHARLQVLYAGLCGSDMHRINGRGGINPQILGHELVGKVVDIKGNDAKVSAPAQIGDVVAACPTLPCNECQNCVAGNDHICTSFHGIGRDAPGGFASHVDVPTSNLHKLSEKEPYKLGVLADVVAVCLHAIDDVAGNVAQKKCLVIGDGAIGSALSVLLHARGASEITISGRHQKNHELLSSFAPIRAANKPDTGQYDFVFETVGRAQLETMEQAVSSVAIRGKIIALGVFPPDFQIAFNNRTLFLKEASLTSSVAYKQKYFPRAIEFLMSHPEWAGFITHEFRFDDFERGLQIMNNKDGNSPVIKVIFNFDNM